MGGDVQRQAIASVPLTQEKLVLLSAEKAPLQDLLSQSFVVFEQGCSYRQYLEQLRAEVMGYYLHTSNETLYTVEYTTEGDKFLNTYTIRTLHIEDLCEVLYLTGADAASGATPVAFTAPAK
ncbi:MAG: hypothetical protein IJ083_17435 [Clostridia bacterium]|nr:hypothetical protein [Clostridia bacterium]